MSKGPWIDLDLLKKTLAEERLEFVNALLEKIPFAGAPEKLITQKQLCSFLQVSRWTIDSLKRKKVIPYVQINSESRFELSKVIAALKKHDARRSKTIHE